MTQLQPTVTDGFVDEELLRLCDELDDIALMQRNIWAEREADQQLDPEEHEHPTQQRIRRLDEGALRLKEIDARLLELLAYHTSKHPEQLDRVPDKLRQELAELRR
jgi:hypothetical protein